MQRNNDMTRKKERDFFIAASLFYRRFSILFSDLYGVGVVTFMLLLLILYKQESKTIKKNLQGGLGVWRNDLREKTARGS
jgi:hypothetical protein